MTVTATATRYRYRCRYRCHRDRYLRYLYHCYRYRDRYHGYRYSRCILAMQAAQWLPLGKMMGRGGGLRVDQTSRTARLRRKIA